jgi:hypothetical protein
MRDVSEAFGEAVAEHHVIPEHYPNAVREPLDGPLNGNDQFDQVWRREDGGYVVVEAKSSVGARNLPDGRRVSQGTRGYFLDIIREMEERGKKNPRERELARNLRKALQQGKVDCIVVKGEKSTGRYTGYHMRQFGISPEGKRFVTVTIPRHSSPGPDDEGYAEALGRYVVEDVEDLEGSPESMDLVLNTAVLHVHARCAVDPRAARLETWEAVVTALQIYSALYAVTSTNEGTVRCLIAHKVRTLPAIGPRTYASAGNWLTAFWLAVICRDQNRLTQLCEVPLDRLRTSDGAYDEYIYHWITALQAYWLQRPGLVEHLTEALRRSHPDTTRIAPSELLQHILYPPINLFYRLLQHDQPGFNQALAEAVHLHKTYWTADQDRTDSPAGMVALAPLAIACLAHDSNIPIDVQTDYLPTHLLERTWLGEFET